MVKSKNYQRRLKMVKISLKGLRIKNIIITTIKNVENAPIEIDVKELLRLIEELKEKIVVSDKGSKVKKDE